MKTPHDIDEETAKCSNFNQLFCEITRKGLERTKIKISKSWNALGLTLNIFAGSRELLSYCFYVYCIYSVVLETELSRVDPHGEPANRPGDDSKALSAETGD